jgi:hypothetical protein
MQPHAHTSSRSSHALLALRVLGAVLLLFVGADHFYEYSVDDYSVVPTIGALFLLNFISASAVGLLLLAPLKRIFHRFGTPALELATLSGFGIAATSLAALLISEQTPLFGFMESNYRPAILVALASETAAALCMALLLVLMRRARSEGERQGARSTRLAVPRESGMLPASEGLARRAETARRTVAPSPSGSPRWLRTTRRSRGSRTARGKSGSR